MIEDIGQERGREVKEMRFVAIDKDRSAGDSDGKGWPVKSRVKEFDETATIKEVWDWYYNHPTEASGILEIVPIE